MQHLFIMLLEHINYIYLQFFLQAVDVECDY